MKSFKQWAESKKLELPLVEAGAAKRQGIAYWAYPDAYMRSQYPANYFTPIASDALLKLQPELKDVKVATGPNTALDA
jgi:protein-disulfide isomerase